MSAVQIGTKPWKVTVGKVMAGLVVTYRAYKTALVLSTQMTKWHDNGAKCCILL